MTDSRQQAVDYFRAYTGYFWKWSNDREAIEWRNGKTLCHIEDLTATLYELIGKEVPIDTILLFLAACNRTKDQVADEILLGQAERLKHHNSIEDDAATTDLLRDVLHFLGRISSLPVAIRSGNGRIHLAKEIFASVTDSTGVVISKDMVDLFQSGKVDEDVFVLERDSVFTQHFVTGLRAFSTAIGQFPDVDRLLLKLRTGLDQLPASATIVLPATSPLPLLDALSEDKRTAGVARLTRRLMAAINIPLHSQATGDQSYGGVSDITNRGNYDRLLISELAQDELLLTARLVNSEALYLRREEPPDNPRRQRTILLDTTLAMWGLPRIFGFSATLACEENTHHNEITYCYSISGKSYKLEDITSVDGVVTALQQLDPSLHCGEGLINTLRELPASEDNEFFFVTEASQLKSVAFQSFFSAVRNQLQFLITVSRDGEMLFYSIHGGTMKQLSRAKLDLKDILSSPVAMPVNSPSDVNIPAFILQKMPPLYFPKNRINIGKKEKMANADNALLLINEDSRVLYWTSKSNGGRELIPFIERGNYSFGRVSNKLYILVTVPHRRDFIKLYTIDLSTYEVTSLNLLENITPHSTIFYRGGIALKSYNYEVLVDYQTGNQITYGAAEEQSIKSDGIFNLPPPSGEQIRTMFIQSNEVFYMAKYISVNDRGELRVGKHTLRILNENQLLFTLGSSGAESKKSGNTGKIPPIHPYVNIKFRQARWADGSIAIIDPRGLLHLKSSDPSLPEITIVLVLGNTVACWASDGTVSGTPYFLQTSHAMPVSTFYSTYINRFIAHLK